MAGSYDHDKVVKFIKANSEIKQSEVAQKLGITIGQVPMLSFNKAQVEAGVYSKAPGTEASVKRLRNEGNRWELIAARTGLSVAAVKAHAESAGVLDSYTGRGRNHSGSTSGRKASTKKTSAKSSTKKTSAKSSTKKTSAAGGRPSARKTGGRPSARKSATSGRRSTAANPS